MRHTTGKSRHSSAIEGGYAYEPVDDTFQNRSIYRSNLTWTWSPSRILKSMESSASCRLLKENARPDRLWPSESCFAGPNALDQGLVIQHGKQITKRARNPKMLRYTCCRNCTASSSRTELASPHSVYDKRILYRWAGYLSLIGPHSSGSLTVLILSKYNSMVPSCMACRT